MFARAILLTTPTVANVGVSLTVPLAIFTDILSKYYHRIPNWSYVPFTTILGAVLVFIGFVLVNTGLEPFENCWAWIKGVRVRRPDGTNMSEPTHNPIVNHESDAHVE